MAAVSPDSPPPDAAARRPWDEGDWNRESTLQSNPYRLSKRLAEEAAWDFVRGAPGDAEGPPIPPFELAVVNPSFILGPPFGARTDAVSIATVRGFLEGAFAAAGVPGTCFGAVDVRDVAAAHVAALRAPDAAGQRCIVSSPDGWSPLRLAGLLAPRFGGAWPLPDREQQRPAYCPRMNVSRLAAVLRVRTTPLAETLEDMAHALVGRGVVRHPALSQPAPRSLADILRRASRKALGGGAAGALAMAIQVLALMWLRTTMNYQYKYGHCTTHAIRLLYREGGLPRFYHGLLPALVQAPLSRFCDTAANTGVLSLLDALPLTTGWPLGAKTLVASGVAASFRVLLMPVDAVKTVMQVEGQRAVPMLMAKVRANGIAVLYHGTFASVAAGFVGHYPWFLVFNELNAQLPVAQTMAQRLLRNAFIGVVASAASDSCSNALRVVKTAQQTSAVPVSAAEVVYQVLREDGPRGFLRGLKTRVAVNCLQGLLFSVLWRLLQDQFLGPARS